MQKYDAPVEQATTASLEALKAYSEGTKMRGQEGDSAVLPLFKRAVELDPNFAVAYDGLGIACSNLGENGLAGEDIRKAYDLRSGPLSGIERIRDRKGQFLYRSRFSLLRFQGDYRTMRAILACFVGACGDFSDGETGW